MDTILRPISLNEKSHNVRLLHKVLRALGVSITEPEIARGQAGPDTF